MRGRFSCAVMAPLGLALLLPGCRGATDDPPPVPTASATPSATASAGVAADGARQVEEETDTFLFEYSYPAAAGRIPELSAWLDARLAEKRSALAAEAARGLREARDNGFPFNKYSGGTAWEVVADLPEWLSLSAELSSYTGGAHPNYGFDTMLWDKQRNLALEPLAFFTSSQALEAAIGAQLCQALNAERAERRGAPVPEGSDDVFDACVTVDETNLLLGSRRGGKFDRIGIQIAPYLAGPYAEGTYEFTFDVTPEILEIVRPEYRAAFAARN